MYKLLTLSITLLFAVTSINAIAHSEHDKARFVSPQGQDIGKCDNALRPCQSISYAFSQASKGDKVLVASGTYNIENEDSLFYFKSGLVPIKGGYNRFDHFQSQSPQSNVVTLVGVPVNMREEIEKMGFSVAIDGKHSLESKRLAGKLASFNEMRNAHEAEKCVNNLAHSFECTNVDLLAHMPLNKFSSLPTDANDIWGHVDLNTGNEFAIIGLNNGISVVDITDPENPVEVGTIPGVDSTWRDVKVYQYFDHTLNLWRAYAYATVDKRNQHVTVIDLNNLPQSISLAENNFSVSNAHNVYISNVDHTLNIAQADMTPSLQLIGANKSGGAFHSYSLANPNTITLTSINSAGDGYTHDGTSITIKDDRKTTDCGQAEGNCTVFIDFQGRSNSSEVDVIKLWNISDANKAKLLSEVTYTDISQANQYVHSGWATEDNQFFFAHDEFDEGKSNINTTIRIFSIEDLKNPLRVGTWTGKTSAVDHNGFVRGNRYYMSTYMNGLTILDISDPANPIDIGNFDTYTTSNRANYDGAWGVYPFLPSGNILISDISGGLYILKDNTLDSTQGNFSFNQSEIFTAQGTSLQLDVYRNTPANDATTVSVSYELIPGSAIQQEDYTPVTGTLTWSGNDNSKKTLSIPIKEQINNQEYKESFFVRLFDPRNGATLKSPSYITVNIDGQVDQGKIGFTLADVSVPENQATLTIDVSRNGSSAGEVSINYSLRAINAEIGSDIEASSGTLTWQDENNENKTISLTIIDDDTEENTETLELVLESTTENLLGANKVIVISIIDDDSNTAPQVSLGENIEVNTGQTVMLTATATDKENDPLTYEWSQSSGTVVSLLSKTQANTSFVAPANAGTLVFSATVTDIKGAKTTVSLTITVVAVEVITITPTPSGGSGGGGSINFYLMLMLFFGILQRYTKITLTTKRC
ncbi:MAG: choice-of-anchor B domain-containing protein [Alteromonadaceae bacterium]|jgi:choice-of-anchor B domain-containing protein